MPTPIDDPLWALLLSTNDCYPGCGCENDFFDITPERVTEWSIANGLPATQQASVMLELLRQSKQLDIDALGRQINRHWYSPEEATTLLNDWQLIIDKVIEKLL